MPVVGDERIENGPVGALAVGRQISVDEERLDRCCQTDFGHDDWSGHALISGRIFGWQLSWVLPVASMLPLTCFQPDLEGNLRWWYWTAPPAASTACWTLAGVFVTIGTIAFLTTPWRMHTILHRSKSTEAEGDPSGPSRHP